MDNTEDSGSSAGGSIPSEGAILLFKIPTYNLRMPYKHLIYQRLCGVLILERMYGGNKDITYILHFRPYLARIHVINVSAHLYRLTPKSFAINAVH